MFNATLITVNKFVVLLNWDTTSLKGNLFAGVSGILQELLLKGSSFQHPLEKD